VYEELNHAISVLADSKASWVNRRDAAEHLGETAHRALTALNAYQSDSDVDVREATKKAFQRGTSGLSETARSTPGGGFTLDELVRGCEKTGERAVTRHGDAYLVSVKLRENRNQAVHVTVLERKDAPKAVRIFTYCGNPSPDALKWALQANLKLARGALALTGDGDDARLVLVETRPLDDLTPERLKACVKEIAGYGDWIEQKMTGLDDF